MHYNTPRLYYELSGRSIARMAAAGAGCFGLALCLYEATAYSGYSLFGAATQSDVLENFAIDDTAANVARVGIAVVMVVSFPIVFNSLRAAMTALLPPAWQARLAAPAAAPKKSGGDGDDDDGVEAASGGSALSRLVADWPFLLLTAVLVACSVLVALALPNLGLVLGYKGALGGTLIVYVMPALFYFLLTRA